MSELTIITRPERKYAAILSVKFPVVAEQNNDKYINLLLLISHAAERQNKTKVNSTSSEAVIWRFQENFADKVLVMTTPTSWDFLATL